MRRRRTFAITLLVIWSIFTLLQNAKNVIDYSILSSTELDRNELDASQQTQDNAYKKYHVALIIATADEAREASFLLKTLVYHRRSLVHLHLVVNDLTHHIMRTLMETWEIDQFDYDLYKDTSKDDSTFYWDALKFRLSDFVKPAVTKELVYLSNDVRLMDDISVLWTEVGGMDKGKGFLGVTSNNNCDNDRFCYTNKILLFDVDKFHQSSLEFALRTTKTKTGIGEILSLYQNRSIFFIPCNWALSFNVTSIREDCAKDWRSVKAVVQSGFETSFVNHSVLERVRERLATVLRSEPPTSLPIGCSAPLATSSSRNDLRQNHKVEGICAEYANGAFLKRRTHLHYIGNGADIGSNESEDPYEIRLLTQLSFDRIKVLERFLELWEGPATVVFHLTDAEAMTLPETVQKSHVLRKKMSVTYHVVYKREMYNPINYIRNVALNNSHSPHFFFVDVDLIPNPGIYSSLKQLIKKHMNYKHNDTVLAVPAFQMFNDLGDATPRNKSQLLQLMPNKTIVGYGMENSWNLGHKPTNYTRWVTAKEPYQAIFAGAFEPYVVVRRNFTARYYELLIERMADKIVYTQVLHDQGFKFFVIPDDFLIHVPHPLSTSRLLLKDDPKFEQCRILLVTAYFKEIRDSLQKERGSAQIV